MVGMKTDQDAKLSSPETWVEKYADTLFSYAVNRVPDPAVAEELVQETFVAGLSSHKSYNGVASEQTWLIGILKHKIMDYFRKSYRQKSISPDNLDHIEEDQTFDERGNWAMKPKKWQENPSHIYEQHEFMDVLEKCLNKMNPRQAGAFRLREIMQTDTDEICKVLGISTTNYWVLMHRARLQIRSCLEADWFLIPAGVKK
jgi:RNA polymerase sigma-70 factor (TIGR02943 family)